MEHYIRNQAKPRSRTQFPSRILPPGADRPFNPGPLRPYDRRLSAPLGPGHWELSDSFILSSGTHPWGRPPQSIETSFRTYGAFHLAPIGPSDKELSNLRTSADRARSDRPAGPHRPFEHFGPKCSNLHWTYSSSHSGPARIAHTEIGWIRSVLALFLSICFGAFLSPFG